VRRHFIITFIAVSIKKTLSHVIIAVTIITIIAIITIKIAPL
jgi:hypothetical protein